MLFYIFSYLFTYMKRKMNAQLTYHKPKTIKNENQNPQYLQSEKYRKKETKSVKIITKLHHSKTSSFSNIGIKNNDSYFNKDGFHVVYF